MSKIVKAKSPASNRPSLSDPWPSGSFVFWLETEIHSSNMPPSHPTPPTQCSAISLPERLLHTRFKILHHSGFLPESCQVWWDPQPYSLHESLKTASYFMCFDFFVLLECFCARDAGHVHSPHSYLTTAHLNLAMLVKTHRSPEYKYPSLTSSRGKHCQ